MAADVGSRSHQAVAGGGRQRQRQTSERALERAEEVFAGEEGEREVGDAGRDQPRRTEVRRHEHQVAEPGEWSPPIPAC